MLASKFIMFFSGVHISMRQMWPVAKTADPANAAMTEREEMHQCISIDSKRSWRNQRMAKNDDEKSERVHQLFWRCYWTWICVILATNTATQHTHTHTSLVYSYLRVACVEHGERENGTEHSKRTSGRYYAEKEEAFVDGEFKTRDKHLVVTSDSVTAKYAN